MQNLIIVTYFFELLPFILCGIFYKKIFATKEGKAFFVYVFIYAVIILLVLLFRYFLDNRIVTALLKRFAIIIEFTLLCIYYSNILIDKNFKKLFYVVIPSFTFLSFYDYYVSVERVISFIPLVIECLFFLILIIYFFYEKIQYNLSTPIYHSMNFWISTAFLIYFSGNFFLFLYSKAAVKNEAFKIQYNLIYNFFTIVKNLLLSIAIIINNRYDINSDDLLIQPELNDSLDSFSTYNKKY